MNKKIPLALTVPLAVLLSTTVLAADAPAQLEGQTSAWQVFDAETVVEADAYYYLEDEVQADLVIPEDTTVTLHLNGQTLTGIGADSVIIVNSGATFDLYDVEGNTGCITGGDASYGGGVYVYEGAFYMHGGKISGNTADYGGGVGVCAAEGPDATNIAIFTMTGGVIENNTATLGGGVYAKSTNFTMENATIKGNTATDSGGGVHVASFNESNSAFIMNDGAIIQNNTASNGGGVYGADGDDELEGTMTFTMNDGASVQENTAKKDSGNAFGGGVYMYYGATFIMNDGATIAHNTVSSVDIGGQVKGGGVYLDESIFEMQGGTIQANQALDVLDGTGTASLDAHVSSQGGGVYVTNAARFTMTGGSISNNSTDDKGGGVYGIGANWGNSTITMSNATVEHNTSGEEGGGIYVGKCVAFAMTDSVLRNNTGNNGGGLHVDNGDSTKPTTATITNSTIQYNVSYTEGGGVNVDGDNVTFIMNEESVISSNTAFQGGGVSVEFSSTFQMNAGAIQNNTASTRGGGVDLCAPKMTISGDVEISGNTIHGKPGNVFVDKNAMLTVTANQTQEIGVLSTKDSAFAILGDNVTATFVSDSDLFKVEDLTVVRSEAGAFGGGTGTSDDPYLIATLEDLNNLSYFVWHSDFNGENIHYRLENDIAITGAFTPVGTANCQFAGIFDGNGKTISGSIGDAVKSEQGLFGHIGPTATVKNLTVDLAVVGEDSVGGIAATNGGTIENCHSLGTITAYKSQTPYADWVGGIVGGNYGTIRLCSNSAVVQGQWYVGGIAGYSASPIEKCYNTGIITGEVIVGGIAGYSGDTIANCYNTGDITATDNSQGSDIARLGGAGGIVGKKQGSTISHCYNTGKVSSAATTSNATSSDKTGGTVGGIVGNFDYGTVEYCVSLGATVTGVQSYAETVGAVVGYISVNADSLQNNYGWAGMVLTEDGEAIALVSNGADKDGETLYCTADGWSTQDGETQTTFDWSTVLADTDAWVLPTSVYELPYLKDTTNMPTNPLVTKPSASGVVPKFTTTIADVENGEVMLSGTRNRLNAIVTITATPDKGYEVADVIVTYNSGKVISITDNGDGTYSYRQPGATAIVAVTFAEIEKEVEVEVEVEYTNPFTDVTEDAYYYDAVQWAVEHGVTTGTSDITFSPDVICTRGEIITFLWRAYGSPMVEANNHFTDLDEEAYYYQAVLWAASQGITSGVTPTTFGADTTCTRSQVATLLWNAAGKPVVDYLMSFEDVAGESWYGEAVRWAASESITSGTSETAFSPEADCTRGQIVTFLYRNMAD